MTSQFIIRHYRNYILSLFIIIKITRTFSNLPKPEKWAWRYDLVVYYVITFYLSILHCIYVVIGVSSQRNGILNITHRWLMTYTRPPSFSYFHSSDIVEKGSGGKFAEGNDDLGRRMKFLRSDKMDKTIIVNICWASFRPNEGQKQPLDTSLNGLIKL